MKTMWFARSKALAWALVLLGGSTVGVPAFAQRPIEPAKPDVPVAPVVGPAPLVVKEGWVTDVAFGPEGRIAAGYDGGGGVVVFDAPCLVASLAPRSAPREGFPGRDRKGWTAMLPKINTPRRVTGGMIGPLPGRETPGKCPRGTSDNEHYVL
jgi:hypothetical protein